MRDTIFHIDVQIPLLLAFLNTTTIAPQRWSLQCTRSCSLPSYMHIHPECPEFQPGDTQQPKKQRSPHTQQTTQLPACLW